MRAAPRERLHRAAGSSGLPSLQKVQVAVSQPAEQLAGLLGELFEESRDVATSAFDGANPFDDVHVSGGSGVAAAASAATSLNPFGEEASPRAHSPLGCRRSANPFD